MKRFLAAALVGLMLCLAWPSGNPAGAAGEAAPLIGDMDGDGLVGAADVAILLRNMAAEEAQCDVTKNGQVDLVDVRAALWMATGQIPDPVKFVERISTGILPEEEFERFCYTQPYDDGEGNYRSANVSVSVNRGTYQSSVYYAADIYVQDVQCIATAFSRGRYRGGNAKVPDMARENKAIIAVNGDFYSQRDMGPIIRNGTTYSQRVNNYWDIALLTTAGELMVFPYRTLTAELLSGLPVYQSWVFGPGLLDDDGNAKTTFRSAVTAVNPRTVLGYYSPGHYCFLVVDGRQRRYSAGLTMAELSALCQRLEFAAAYNLDGGQSTAMATKYGLVNQPAGGGRAVSDILYVRDLED